MMVCARPYLLAALLAGCVAPVTTPPPRTVHTVAVLRPDNRTGDDLLVSGTSFLEKYAFHTEPVTVPDILALELRAQLASRGFAVVSPDVVHAATEGRVAGGPQTAADIARRGHIEDPVLFVAIDQWQSNGGTQPAFVIVALDATLVEPATGTILWHTRRRARPIPTPGAVTLGSAYEIAAAKAAEELLASWGTEPPRS